MSIEVVFPANFPRVDCEPRLLQRVLAICLQNGVKHHDRKQGKVELSASVNNGSLLVEIRDDGPGIPPEFHGRVFEMFQTLRPRDAIDGSGMGLPLARKMVDLVGGHIEVASDGVRGTCVRIRWPRRRRRASAGGSKSLVKGPDASGPA